MADNSAVASPCNGTCKLDKATGTCTGCLRTAMEIAEWPRATQDRRLEILGLLRTRRRAAGRTSPADSKPRRRPQRV
ncbi:DUF1289 domain-containing protein [Fodinicurvata sp. EGI_FJ10296]|uniref:DUF1289 domain-containing protein n=1 Tax=Fodinicurvata sp. EGI_FJ10296 TaxID=3231908 RepID=UPI003455CA69